MPEEEDDTGFWLSDRAFGRLLARVLARAHGRPAPRRYRNGVHNQGMMLSLMYTMGVWVKPVKERKPDVVRAFRDQVRLAVETSDRQRAIIDEVGARHGLPPFSQRGPDGGMAYWLARDTPRFTDEW